MLMREQAYETFTERLLAREISPGQFVSQRELVQITGMPLAAIREMVLRLEADGLIRTVPKRGLQIAHVDLELIRNAFQLRDILEREAVRHFVRTATYQDIERLKEEHLAVRQAAEQGNTMIDALDNQLIANIYRVNSIKIRLICQENTRLLPRLVISVMDEHLSIINALARRDEDAAVAAMAAHVDSAKRRAMKL